MLKSTPKVRKSPRSGLNLEGRLSDPQIDPYVPIPREASVFHTDVLGRGLTRLPSLVKLAAGVQMMLPLAVVVLGSILLLRLTRMGPAGLAVKPLDLHVVNMGSIHTGPTHGEV